LKSYKLAIAAGHEIDAECLQCALTAVNNLAMNENNQALLAVSLPAYFILLMKIQSHGSRDQHMLNK